MENQQLKQDQIRAIDVWGQYILDREEHSSETFMEALFREPPYMVSAVMERTCNQRCLHCLYQDEKSSVDVSRDMKLDSIIKGMVRQLPNGSSFLHCGRITRPWHLEVLADLREERGREIELGVIDNGSYTSIIDHFARLSLRLDWLDVSIDGDRKSHNQQRQSAKAYDLAREGILQGRRVADKVTSLMTLTKLNSHTVKSVVEDLLLSGEVDELHFTPASPYREINVPHVMELEDTAAAFLQLIEVAPQVTEGKMIYRMYRVEDLELLANAVGLDKFQESFDEGLVDHGRINFRIDGVSFAYYPLSIWPQEEVLIDADGMYRVAGSGQFSLADYREGGRKVAAYEVEQLTGLSDLQSSYQKAVRLWWHFHGLAHLRQEAEVIRRIIR